ncbi:MAG: glycosyltransferase family 4 protein [Solirubrobacteraceae bacterium]
MTSARLHAPAGACAPVRSAGTKPRLLILTPDFPPDHGGVQVLVHGLALAMTGFEIEVVTLERPGARRFDSGGELATWRVGARVGGRPARMLSLNAAGLRRALRFRPDVTLSAHVITSPAATAVRRLLGGRTAQYFHANEILGKPRLSAFAAARADVVIAVSAYTASLIAATGASPMNLRLIPPGVDLPCDPGALPTERPTVLTTAQLKHSYKGHDVLIRALAGVRARVPDVEWVVIGEGPLRASLEQLASSCGLAGAARFLGEVTDEERDCWLRRADVFAMPSRLAGEGFGIVYLEASAYGKPIVAGNVAGALDAVADGVSGLLVDPTDPAAVGEAVTRLLLDRELAGRLGRDGAARARDFAWPVIAGRVEAALLEPTRTGS